MRKFIAALASVSLLCAQTAACAYANDNDYSWAETEIEYCRTNGIMTGDENGNLNPGGTLTRAQMAKMLVEGFELDKEDTASSQPAPSEIPMQNSFSDVSQDMWYYSYAETLREYMTQPGDRFNGDEIVTREEFASTLVRASGLTEGNIRNSGMLEVNFKDSDEVSSKYRTLMTIAVERAYFRGSDGYLRPQDNLTRAEVCALLYRVIESNKGNITLTWEDLGIEQTYTPLLGEAQISLESAKAWAAAKGAAELFINAADYYWQYGELTGIRPEILYAQAAKETGYGKYGGAVTPDMNNFAGIKKYGATGDEKDDHESFATQEDGVRAHFNHMSAYIGLEPIGEVHGRYNSVKSLSWAGTIKSVEALGGRWCPDLYYGYSIVRNYLNNMSNY